MAYYVHMKIARDPYGTTSYGKAIDKITLENSSGYSVEVITYGAYLISFKGPDRDGRIEELTKNFPSLSDYQVPTTTTARRSAGMPTGSAAAASPSTGSSSSSSPHTIRSSCTAAPAVLTPASGKHSP